MNEIVIGWPDDTNVVDGTQGSPDAGILAAAYCTISGGVVTIVGQKNVTSVVRNGTGRYTVTMTSAAPDTNYGVICAARRASQTNVSVSRPGPNRNTTTGENRYTTTVFDIYVANTSSANAHDPIQLGFIVFDPNSVDSSFYRAAATWTLSGTTLTLQNQLNVASMTRQAAGYYRLNFNTALPDADYAIAGFNRSADSTNNDISTFGGARNTTLGYSEYSTTQLSTTGTNGGSLTVSEKGRGGVLIRDGASAPRGTLASVYFTVSGGVITIVDQWNVAGVTYVGAGQYRVDFSEPLIDTNYMVIANGRGNDFSDGNVPVMGLANSTSPGMTNKSTTRVDVESYSSSSSGAYIECSRASIWVVKPWLM